MIKLVFKKQAVPHFGLSAFKKKFPYISLKDEASDFKFGMQLGFANSPAELWWNLALEYKVFLMLIIDVQYMYNENLPGDILSPLSVLSKEAQS